MGVEFIEVQKAGPELSPTPPSVSYQSAYQNLYALALTFLAMYKGVSWIRSCVDIIANAATSEEVVVRLVQQQQELDDEAENPRVQAMRVFLNKINPKYDAMELANRNIKAMQINGTSYCRKLRKAGGKQLVGLEYIPFARVKPNVDDLDQIISWSIRSKRGTSIAQVPFEDIAVFKIPHPDDEHIGLSPLESLDLPVGLDIQAQRFNEAAFRNGPYASMVLRMQNADENEVTRNREYINNNFTKPENAHKPMLLEGEIEVIGESLMRRSVDGSFIELRKLNREEIAAVYGVPITKIVTDGANRSNTEEHDETFIRDTIEPVQKLYWNQFNRQILQDEFGIFDMVVVPGKKQDVNMTNVNIAAKMVTAGATGNEARKIMNLNSMDGYDVPMFAKMVVPEDNAEASAKVDKTPTSVPPQKVTKAEQDDSNTDIEPTDTSQQEHEFEIIWLALMQKMRRRAKDARTVNDLYQTLLPNSSDLQAISETINDLYNEVWLMSYNRRRSELGQPLLDGIPTSIENQLSAKAVSTASDILDTYKNELSDKLKQAIEQNKDSSFEDQKKKIETDINDWLKTRAQYKAEQISITEAGKAWNDGLFSHDREFAPETEYYVFPIATNHEECAAVIAGSPYTLDTIPADLPLHPNCPHRYYAVVYDKK